MLDALLLESAGLESLFLDEDAESDEEAESDESRDEDDDEEEDDGDEDEESILFLA